MSHGQLCLFKFSRPLLDRFGGTFFDALPKKPGVYLFSDARARVLYVGQSHNLRERLAYYKNAQPEREPRKIIRLVHQTEMIRWMCCETPEEAQLREVDLIREHRPRFNTAHTLSPTYTFFGVKRHGGELTFRFTLRASREEGEELFGAFKNHGLCRKAFRAAGRTMWRLQRSVGSAYDFPLQLSDQSRVQHFNIGVSPSVIQALRAFLLGGATDFLEYTASLIESETDAFLKKIYETDLLTLTEFFVLSQRMKGLRQGDSEPSVLEQSRIDPLLLESRFKVDSALRAHFHKERFTPAVRRGISRNVFAYYRWMGWLDPHARLRDQLREAIRQRDRYAADPGSIPDSELRQKAVPAWSIEVADLPAETIRVFQEEPRLWLRARPGRAVELSKMLEHCEVASGIPDAIWYRGEEDLFRTAAFHEGLFEIQDISSQFVSLICDPQPGQTWWDACAGEGGKTLHLCDLMQNKGLVWASDPAEWRIKILKKRAARAGVFNYRTKVWPASGQIPTRTQFDGVLVDAPCSGIGTWGKNPHARWTTTAKDVEELAAVQSQLLAKVAASVKPGGRLVYSVCTLSRRETIEVVAQFNVAHPEFSLERTKFFFPHEAHGNGMYVSVWQRALR